MSLFAYLFGHSPTPQRSRMRPELEALEDRVVPAVFMVNVADDTPDTNLNDPEAKDANGNTSLRAAIMQANATAGLETIKFDIANGAAIIKVETSPLPPITDQVVIDAATRPANRPLQWILLSPQDVGNKKLKADGIAGFTFQAGAAGSEVIGLTVFGFDQTDSAGIKLDNVASVTVRNVNLYNNLQGVFIRGANARDNSIVGSRIGQVGGIAAGFDPQVYGVFIDAGAHDNYIGLDGAANTNIISGNSNTGVRISNANNNVVRNNYIGIGFDGMAFNPVNQGVGVYISGTAAGNVIGGSITFAPLQIVSPANVISGNMKEGVLISGGGASNKVQGNFIGTDKEGTRLRGNGWNGVNVQANGTLVGGPGADLGNVIVNNGTDAAAGRAAQSGVLITSNDNTVGYNKIGLSNNGLANQGNAGDGLHFLLIAVTQGTNVYHNNFKHNLEEGVLDFLKQNKLFNSNTYASNGGLGIDIGLAGVTTDGMPVLTSAIVNGATLTVSGSLTNINKPNTTFAIDLYGNTAPDESGYGEGEFFLGTVEVTTDSSGTVTFTTVVDGGYDGFFVTATATDLVEGGTSEFAKNVVAYLPATVQMHVFEDINGNGVQDFYEAYWQGMDLVITLQSTTGGATYTRTFEGIGIVTFEGVVADTYTLTFTLPTGYEFTLQNQGSDENLDSDVDASGTTDPFTILAGEFNSSFAAGLYLLGGYGVG